MRQLVENATVLAKPNREAFEKYVARMADVFINRYIDRMLSKEGKMPSKKRKGPAKNTFDKVMEAHSQLLDLPCPLCGKEKVHVADAALTCMHCGPLRQAIRSAITDAHQAAAGIERAHYRRLARLTHAELLQEAITMSGEIAELTEKLRRYKAEADRPQAIEKGR